MMYTLWYTFQFAAVKDRVHGATRKKSAPAEESTVTVTMLESAGGSCRRTFMMV